MNLPEMYPRIYQIRLSRRSFMRGAGGIGLGLAAAAILGCEKEPTITANHVYQGEVAILRGVNLRTEPKMKSLGGPTDNNTIPWSQITAINGVKLNGANAFLVENPPIVYGENPANFVDRSIKSPWIQVIATVKGLPQDRKVPVHINMSPYTDQNVVPDSIFAQGGIEPRRNEGEATEGKVTPLQSEDLRAWLSPEGRLQKTRSMMENLSPEIEALVQKYEITLYDPKTTERGSGWPKGPVGPMLTVSRERSWEGKAEFRLFANSDQVLHFSAEELSVYILSAILTAEALNSFWGTYKEKIDYQNTIEDEMQVKALALLTENDNFTINRIHNPLFKAALAKQDGSKLSPVSQK